MQRTAACTHSCKTELFQYTVSVCAEAGEG